MSAPAVKRRVRLAQLVLLVVVIAGSAFVATQVTSGGSFGRGYDVQVDLAASGGLYRGADVTYRGQSIGRISGLVLTTDGVRATARIEPGVRIPRDTLAVVANLSAVGEQKLDFRPRTDTGPYLADGAVVAADDTRQPIPAATVLDHADALGQRIDVRDLNVVSRELAAGLGDPQVDLPQLVTDGQRTLSLLQRLQPATTRIVERGQIPLTTAARSRGQLREFATNLDLITAELQRGEESYPALITGTTRLTTTLRGTLRDSRSDLDQLLLGAGTQAQILAVRQPALRSWFDALPLQMTAMAEGTRGGSGRVILVPSASKACSYGTKERPPSDHTHGAPNLSGHCRTSDPRVQQRGSQYAPRP